LQQRLSMSVFATSNSGGSRRQLLGRTASARRGRRLPWKILPLVLQQVFLFRLLLSDQRSVTAWQVRHAQSSRIRVAADVRGQASVAQPFGRQDYWEGLYDAADADFSWYSNWDEMEPFVREWAPVEGRILLPGIGSDVGLLQALFQANYTQLDAFDYAENSIAHCQEQLAGTPLADTVNLAVADATQLVDYADASMAVVLDKGTLDAIFLAGDSLEERQTTLRAAVCELQRVLQPSSGIFWSLSGICTNALRALDVWEGWTVCADSTVDMVTTEDGYTSNNLDGDLLVWRKPPTIVGQ
jgi:hypothetical protein